MGIDRFIGINQENEKVRHLVETLRSLGLECARTIEEKIDLQFSALENLHENLNNDELFIKLVLANAIVSYQLSGKGEDWWWEFSRHFSINKEVGSIKKAYASFLPSSRTNRRLVGAKLKRLERLEPFLRGLNIDDLKEYYDNMLRLRDDLAKALNSGKDAKTIVFAVKMFGYAARIAFKKFKPYPMEIPIPEDVRILRYTKRFTTEPPGSFWGRIGRQTGIPPLHIDSLVWPALGKNDEVMARLKRHCPRWRLVLEITEI
ncbi:N-glycosylase [Thermococcus sp. P6]|uniref:N-glycosylase/DNA lyase n=1 Tax=Thermococcus sp. P6 TaxID=122420 RepID=UPI000B59DB08|nr:N-glycosylase/DNA lyase [Thermococcus sp. P6]ASJ10901.1 N-glycosylase [Thermococcus sp. P6]